MTGTAINTLKRYTTPSSALDMLLHERLTLLSPSTWQDKNDIAFVEAYRAKRAVPHVFAACFTQAPETYHHWSVFAGNNEGVRVNINKRKFLTPLVGRDGFLWNDVVYRTLDELASVDELSIFELPFLKRHAFKDEREFRLLCECGDPAATHQIVDLKRE